MSPEEAVEIGAVLMAYQIRKAIEQGAGHFSDKNAEWIVQEMERLQTELTDEKSAHAQTAAAFHDEERYCEQGEAKLAKVVEVLETIARDRKSLGPELDDAVLAALIAAKEKL